MASRRRDARGGELEMVFVALKRDDDVQMHAVEIDVVVCAVARGEDLFVVGTQQELWVQEGYFLENVQYDVVDGDVALFVLRGC